MQELLVVLAVLACPVGMGLMMVFMGRGMRRGGDGGERGTTAAEREHASLAELKGEHARLGAQIDALEAARSEQEREQVRGS